ncbi:MAG: hydrogenase maturation protease [Candidatus Heimdallarchaeum endolithica]|uniref:Hydrogenase maturation protease n=1 Tax=Candidatus Heimdallarchaeum endolithica TaxID=2876572 RepID=A0A9Y1BS00_9ARCH|nr:MAG: hydrogenase maturation protease [Candidatus Heimdallarchaeum endolithica]
MTEENSNFFSFSCFLKPGHTAFLCFGNLDRSDDAIGLLIARELKRFFSHVYSEEFEDPINELLTILEDEKIECVTIIDACDIKTKIGSLIVSSSINVAETRLSTHTIPIKQLVELIQNEGKEFVFIGIQVSNVEFMGKISDEVMNAKKKILSWFTKENQ